MTALANLICVDGAEAEDDCTLASHDEMRADRKLFLALTVPAYWQPDEDVEIEVRNCILCRSSISDGTTRRMS